MIEYTICYSGLINRLEFSLKEGLLYIDQKQVARYYEQMTESYLRYGSSSHGWHYGLWDDSTTTMEQALIRSNQILIEDCHLQPGQLILDTGCGVGGLAFWLAETFEVSVIGITICQPHVNLATQLAREMGLDHKVEFRFLDFMNLDFEDETFDFVFSQESFCYASEKEDYLKGVQRVLKPGGRWQVVDGFRSSKPLTETTEGYHRDLPA